MTDRVAAAILAHIAAMRTTDAPSGLPLQPPAGPPNQPNPAVAPAQSGAPTLRAIVEEPVLREVLLAPHAPLRMISAQLLWAAAPLAELFGVDSFSRWAAALEAPEHPPHRATG